MLKKRWREITIVLALTFIFYKGFRAEEAEEQSLITKITVIDKVEEVQWEGFDSLSFPEAFNNMYAEHGKGYVFNWRGSNYLTIYKEER
tara:strand:+ start:174 stop:440 length:267 start_codon:yes stop_codon:yes gene_type:complete